MVFRFAPLRFSRVIFFFFFLFSPCVCVKGIIGNRFLLNQIKQKVGYLAVLPSIYLFPPSQEFLHPSQRPYSPLSLFLSSYLNSNLFSSPSLSITLFPVWSKYTILHYSPNELILTEKSAMAAFQTE